MDRTTHASAIQRLRLAVSIGVQIALGVTDLAIFAYRSGDIDDRAEDVTTAREGIKAQQAYQAKLKRTSSTYETEVHVKRSYEHAGISLQITGRADGVNKENQLDGTQLLIEEIKTTRKQPDQIPTCDRSVHEAQLRLYAAMLDSRSEAASIVTRLTYLHPDNGTVTQFDQPDDVRSLDAFFEDAAREYCAWVRVVLDRIQERNAHAKAQKFPFDPPNENQLQLARQGFLNLRDEADLLFEAPTGTGKTMATAFPVTKAMGEGVLDRVVFSTARTTGQQAAVDAFSTLREQNEKLVQVTVSAKERVCLTPGAACRPEECEYAHGHYDRVRDAMRNLLRRGQVDRIAVDRVARSSKVCPFELSLDAAEWADVVVCDYNYVFDPLIQLKRLKSRLFRRVGLLVDEAHRLTERVRDMLTCEFDLETIAVAVDAVQGLPIEPLFKQVQRSLERFIATELATDGETIVDEIAADFPHAVVRLLESDELRLLNTPELKVVDECLFEFVRYRTIREISEEDPRKFVWLLSKSENSRTVKFRCLLPNRWVAKVIDDFHGSIRFSGTLTPGELFNEEHGLQGPIKYAKLNPRPTSIECVCGARYLYVLRRTATDGAAIGALARRDTRCSNR